MVIASQVGNEHIILWKSNFMNFVKRETISLSEYGVIITHLEVLAVLTHFRSSQL